MKLAVPIEALAAQFRAALGRASKLGVEGVAFDAVGELAPHRLSATGRREIGHLLRSHDLSLAAIHCPLRRGLDEPADLEPRLARIRDAITLSVELGARLVAMDPGPFPNSDDQSRWEIYREALADLGRHGDRIGATVALTISSEPADDVLALLGRFDTAALGVCFDPASSFQSGIDPVQALMVLARRILLVRAVDARRRGSSRVAEIVPLGHGDLDWLMLAGTLAAHEYRGWIALDRRGLSSEADLARSVAFLRRLI
jgi:sugar phosphate isomerase/epimerase